MNFCCKLLTFCIILLLTCCNSVKINTSDGWADSYAIPSSTQKYSWWVPLDDLKGADKYWVNGHPCIIRQIKVVDNVKWALLVKSGRRRTLSPNIVGWTFSPVPSRFDSIPPPFKP